MNPNPPLGTSTCRNLIPSNFPHSEKNTSPCHHKMAPRSATTWPPPHHSRRFFSEGGGGRGKQRRNRRKLFLTFQLFMSPCAIHVFEIHVFGLSSSNLNVAIVRETCCHVGRPCPEFWKGKRGCYIVFFLNIVCLCFVGGGVREVGTACVVLDRLRCGGGFLFGGRVRFFSRGSFSEERMLFSNVLWSNVEILSCCLDVWWRSFLLFTFCNKSIYSKSWPQSLFFSQ